MASITVDGETFEAPPGAPLVEVLKNNGVYTSSLCYIDGLKPYAGCRMCLVDIEGPPGLQLSCTAIVQDGMKVTTRSDEVREARKSVLSIILANHSDRCLTCHRREHCHPGDICLRDDVVTHRCLTCSKNYRCELQATCEMVGTSGYEPWVGEERSWYQAPHPPADRANPFLEFDPQMCIICTRCVRACDEIRHTGALTLGGKGWSAEIAFGAGGPIHESNCDFCGACIDVCPTATLMEHPNKWIAKPDTWTSTTCDSCAIGCSLRIGAKDGRGSIVRPGTGNPVNGSQICVRGRFHYDSLKPRERLGQHYVRRGPVHAPVPFEDAIAEAAELLAAAARKGHVGVLAGATLTNEEALLANLIAHNAFAATADTSLGPVIRATRDALAARFGTWRLPADMTRIAGARAIIVVHDDIEESHQIASMRARDAVVNNGAKLITIGALRSELTDFAAAWLRAPAGDEGRAASALADAISSRQPGEGELARAIDALKDVPPEDVLIICAPNPVSPPRAAAMAGGAANLAIALCGEAASHHLVMLPPAVNVNGLLDVGVALEGSARPLEGLAGLLVVRDDPRLRLPGAAEALSKIETLVVIDNVRHETARSADVLIAEGRAYASRGTYTQGDFRVQRLEPALRPEGEAVSCFHALRALAEALDIEPPVAEDEALVALANVRADYQPAADLIVGDGIRLRIDPAPQHTMAPVAGDAPGDGMRIITGRDLYTAEDAASLKHPDADRLHRYDHIEIGEGDAARLNIHEDDSITVRSGNISVTAPARPTERVPDGHVYLSSLLQGGAVQRFVQPDGTLARVELSAS